MRNQPHPNDPGTHERELFLGALEIETRAARDAYLDCACAGDQALKNRIVELLDEHERMGTFLQTPALKELAPPGSGQPSPDRTVRLENISEKAGDRIGRYKLLQQIGEGGCGVVYMAEQEEPVRRRVALKVIKLGMDTKSVIARFEAERQALAMMDHPNIAKVLDAGATEAGRPYFVMELVRGIKITQYCDEHQLQTAGRLKLFIQVCQAIQHAHQKGIIHRDIKPSNILVTLHDGVPVPKVIDFGIAKATEQRLTEKTLFTEFTAFIGTPAYMSPEQAEMSGLDIDTRSDIYSLGVVLYELLTGTTPFDAEALFKAGLDECRRTIREKEPVRPSTRLETMLAPELTSTANLRQIEAPKLIHSLRGDLDWVVMKCLEKDRTRRYDTSASLGMDLQRYLEDEPVLARPPSNVYRLKKMLHRHRGLVTAAACIALALLVGAGVSTWQAVRATRAEHRAYAAQRKEAVLRRQAEHGKSLARLNEYVADINLAQKNLSDGNYGKAMRLLRKHLPAPNERDLRGFEWRYLWQVCHGEDDSPLPPQDGPVQSLACSPDGHWLAVGLRDKLGIWDTRTKTQVSEVAEGVVSMAFTPDGKWLVAGSPRKVRILRTADWAEELALGRSAAPVSLSKDGAWLATLAMEGDRPFPFPGRGRSGIRIWDTAKWQERRTIPGLSGPMIFSPDGGLFAADSPQGITVTKLDSEAPPVVLQDSTNLMVRFPGPMFGTDHMLAFAPDGKSIVGPRNTLSQRGVFVLSIWDTQTGEEKGWIPSDPEHVEHTGFISYVDFLPHSQTLATASWDHSIRLWDFGRRQLKNTLHGHLSEVRTMAFFADGQTLVSGSKDGRVKLWKTEQPQKEPVLPGWEPIRFSSDSKSLAVLNRFSNTVAFLNLETGELAPKIPLGSPFDRMGPPRPPSFGGESPERDKRPGGGPRGGGMGFEMDLAFTADLSVIAQGLNDGTVRLWNTRTLETNSVKVGESRVEFVAVAPDGSELITSTRGRMGPGSPLHWWDLRQGTNGVFQSEASRAWFSPDGRSIAVRHWNSGIEVWDRATHLLRFKISTNAPVHAFAFSPDGLMIATTAGPDDPENAVQIWNANTGKLLAACTGHKQTVSSVAFSPDNATLATASDDSTVRLWNIATQQELLSVQRLGGGLRGLLFSPDGQLLAGASGLFAQKGGIQFFHAPIPTQTASR